MADECDSLLFNDLQSTNAAQTRAWCCHKVIHLKSNGKKFTSRYQLPKNTVFRLLSEVNIHEVWLRSRLRSLPLAYEHLYSPQVVAKS